MFNIICDYFIFFGFLIGSTLFPLWGSLMRKKKPTDQADTKANYVFATGQVGIFAMMLSIARGTLGVRAFLGKFFSAILCNSSHISDFHVRNFCWSLCVWLAKLAFKKIKSLNWCYVCRTRWFVVIDVQSGRHQIYWNREVKNHYCDLCNFM